MPFIQIHLAEGRSVEQKREIAAAVTADVSRIAEVSPDRVKIYFFDIKGRYGQRRGAPRR